MPHCSNFRSAAALALALPLALGACAGPDQRPGAKTARDEEYQRQLREVEERYNKQLSEAKGELVLAQDTNQQLTNELDRISTSYEASRFTKARLVDENKALVDNVDRLRADVERLEREKQALADRPGVLDAPAEEGSELAMAQTMLLEKEAQLRQLRDELAMARAGQRRAVDPDVASGVRLVTLDLDTPVGKVGERPVTRRDLVDFLYRDTATIQHLQMVARRILVLQEGHRRKIEISEDEITRWVQAAMLEVENSVEATKQVQAAGLDRAALEARLRYQAEPSLVLARIIDDERQTPAGQALFEEVLRQVYEQQHGQRVEARRILIKITNQRPTAYAKRSAMDVIKQLQNNQYSFAEAARKHSDDPATKPLGGKMPPLGRQALIGEPELLKVLFTTPVGQLHPYPVRTKEGYNVVFVERMNPGRPITAVRSQLVEQLRDQPHPEEIQYHLQRLWDAAEVELRLDLDDERTQRGK